MLKSFWRWATNNETLILLLLLATVLRLPSLFEPNWYGDEGIYLTLGQAFRKGLVWYRDIHDNKPPLLYLLAAFTGSVFWFRLLLTFWFGVTVAVFYRLCQRLFPKTPAAWNLSTLVMIILTTIFEGNISNAEIFIVLPVSLGMLLALRSKATAISGGVIGLLFCLGFLFKVPAAFDFLALIIWLIIWKRPGLKTLIFTGLGFGVPVLATIIYYAYQGALEPYVRSALLQNIGYLSSWNTGEHSASGFTSESGLLSRLVVVTGGLSLFILLAKKFKLAASTGLVVIWFAWSMFGALLSERPYPHYLIQPAVPLALLVSFFFFGRRKLLKLIILIVGLWAGWSYYQIRFWQYPVITYYQNFIEFGSGQKTLGEYRAWFDPRVNQNYRLAEYIRRTTEPDDLIFIWGDDPAVYSLANRLPVGRFTVAYHVIDFNGYHSTLEAWDKYQPRVVAVMKYEDRHFPGLETRLTTDYVLAATIDAAQVYRHLDGITP